MKVLMRRNPAAAYGCKLQEGQTGSVDGALGRRLVAAGIAISLDDCPTPPVRAVPPSPAIADATPPAIEAKPKSKARRATGPKGPGPFYAVGDE